MTTTPLDQPITPLPKTSIRSTIRIALEYLSLAAASLTVVSIVISLAYLPSAIVSGFSVLLIAVFFLLLIALNIIIIRKHWAWRKATLKYEASQNSRFLRAVKFSIAVKSAAVLSTFWVFSFLLILGNLVGQGSAALEHWQGWLLVAALLVHTLAAPVQLYYLENIRKLQASKTGRSYQPIAILGKSDPTQSLGNSNYWG